MPQTHNTKNYFAHGGNELVVGGKLTFLDGAEVENFPGGGSGGTYTLPTASSTTLGGVKIGQGLTITDGVLATENFPTAAAQADSEATTIAALKEDFNALLAALRNAGLMAATAEPDAGEENAGEENTGGDG